MRYSEAKRERKSIPYTIGAWPAMAFYRVLTTLPFVGSTHDTIRLTRAASSQVTVWRPGPFRAISEEFLRLRKAARQPNKVLTFIASFDASAPYGFL